MGLKEAVFGIGKVIGKNSPHILTAVGIASYISAIVMAAKAAPKAKPAYDRVKEEYDEAIESGADRVDATVDLVHGILSDVAPYYVGVGGTAILGTVCVIAADRVHVKRNTAIMAAYTLSEKALDIYQEKVVEKLGDKKHTAVMDEIAASDDPFGKDPANVDILDPEGVLCYDHVTGRYFKSSIEAVRSAEADVVKRLIDETVVPLNDLYYELGMTDVSVIGDVLGWDAGRTKLDIHFTSMLDKNGVPCLVLNYRTCMINGTLL